ncbi:hypothetical protein E3E22_01640 [Thermococcus sp. MV5]|uniref:hypothetical protein n=1 Tax=Thermococcus sp. MV5 TaxID=1638272 RepID=UPI001439E831|nr:hypothetical protein [Thermococcus sp. MV5]NJE25353.1 hypothetical protein [Thermococcus sp. MV5]
MREIFNREGIFIKFDKKVVKLENGDELVHKQERPTNLWWELKEVIKGKKIKIIVYELGE